MHDHVRLDHGSGGRLARELVEGLFLKHFRGESLSGLSDAALLPTVLLDEAETAGLTGYSGKAAAGGRLAFTTDSHVVTPRFFPGGDIGKLAICGTVNDLAVSGAVPAYLSAGFVIEEGFPMEELERIVQSMAREAEGCGVEIATGDTKVVERGSCDGLFINTAGVGFVPGYRSGIISAEGMVPGDKVLINGCIGDHGLAVTAARNSFELSTPLESDCASLNGLIGELLRGGTGDSIRFMRDPTRGGLATVLCELAETAGTGIELEEAALPVREEVRGLCEVLGYDPLYVANEGKCVVVAAAEAAEELLDRMRRHPLGTDAALIGEITAAHPRTTLLRTLAGGRRVVDMLAGGQLPRIC